MKVETQTVHVVSDSDYEDFARAIYGRKAEFVASTLCGNDSAHTFTVTGEIDEKWDRPELDKWISGESLTVDPGIVLNDLASRGLILNGNYVIKVCW